MRTLKSFLVFLGLFCIAATAQAASKAYISNETTNSVFVVDTASRAILTQVPFGEHPNGG